MFQIERKKAKMNSEMDVKLYCDMLHKSYNDMLEEISNINIKEIKDQDEFRKIVKWIHVNHFDKFMKAVEILFKSEEEEHVSAEA